MARQVLDIISETRSDLKNLKGAFGAEEQVAEADLILATLADRFVHPVKPLVVALCGPTGAGKSHLVNFLAGGAVSPSSYRRPSTSAPVIVGQPDLLASLDSAFLPEYDRVEAPGGVIFDNDHPGAEPPGKPKIYLTPVKAPSWDWPKDLLIIDTPDFDSVRLENQIHAYDMARRADAVILVTHQAKYADQSTWDFLAKRRRGADQNSLGTLLLIVNRVTDQAAADDFKARLKAAGNISRLLAWPEEAAIGQVSINAARKELVNWLGELGQRGIEVTAASGRSLAARLAALAEKEILPSFISRRDFVESALIRAREITSQWMDSSSDRLASNLPQETRVKIQKGLEEVVSRSDLWAKPRRWLAVPFGAAEAAFKRLFGREPGTESAERKLAESLEEAGREALVVAVRGEARALAEAAGLPSPQAELDLTPEEIRETYRLMMESRNIWLKEEMEHLLKDLPWAKKAGFYFIQATHLLVVGGLLIQTGGIPGTETLVSGALGPFLSKFVGAIISKESLDDFEARAAARHHKQLAEVFRLQGARYQEFMNKELALMAPGLKLEEKFKAIDDEARHVWA